MTTVRVRPVRLRRLCMVLAVLIVVVFAFVALLLRSVDTGASFGLADQVSVFGIGLAVAAGILVLARPTLEADERELRIRNVIGRHVLPWTAVRAVLFRDNRPWAAVELVNDDELPLMAVQAADGDRTVAAVRTLRELHRRSTEQHLAEQLRTEQDRTERDRTERDGAERDGAARDEAVERRDG